MSLFEKEGRATVQQVSASNSLNFTNMCHFPCALPFSVVHVETSNPPRFGTSDFCRFGTSLDTDFWMFGTSLDTDFCRFGTSLDTDFWMFGTSLDTDFWMFGTSLDTDFWMFGTSLDTDFWMFGTSLDTDFCRFGTSLDFYRQMIWSRGRALEKDNSTISRNKLDKISYGLDKITGSQSHTKI